MMVIKSRLFTDVNVQVSQTHNIFLDFQCSSDAGWRFPQDPIKPCCPEQPLQKLSNVFPMHLVPHLRCCEASLHLFRNHYPALVFCSAVLHPHAYFQHFLVFCLHHRKQVFVASSEAPGDQKCTCGFTAELTGAVGSDTITSLSAGNTPNDTFAAFM